MIVTPLQAQTPAAKASSTHESVHAVPEASIMGELSNGAYHNNFFRFTLRVPFGWVDRTEDMREGSNDAQSVDTAKPGTGKSIVLLAEFERPPEATGETINSAVVITAEAVSAYPGLKTAADYFGSISELATAKGFKSAGDPYEFAVGTRQVVRGDFSKELGKLTMYQSLLVKLEKNYALSFTFLGGSEDEIDELIDKLDFSAKRAPAARK